MNEGGESHQINPRLCAPKEARESAQAFASR